MKHGVIVWCMLGLLLGLTCLPVQAQEGWDESAFYAKSWAVVIGINAYQNFPSLEYAVNDATAIATRLRSMGFEVTTLLDREATKDNIRQVLKEQIPNQVGPDDRLVIFYAGHGAAGILPTGEEVGFIIPTDGKSEIEGRQLQIVGGEIVVDEYESFAERASFLSVDDIRDISDLVAAKHILYIIDGCYSGFLDPAAYSRLRPSRRIGKDVQVAQRSESARSLVLEEQETATAPIASVPASSQDPLKYLEVITTRDTVQILTAGSSGEEVYEKSGHGVFTYYLLRALDGAADISDNPNSPVGDCVITATELGNYLKEKVPEASSFSQSPLFNRISGEGEFIFVPPICRPIDHVDTQPPRDDASWQKTEAYKGPQGFQYKAPTQVLVDHHDNLFVLDTGLNQILKFDSQGQFLPEQQLEPVNLDGSWQISSMAIGYGGELWVYYSWTGRTRSRQESPAGKVVVYNSDGTHAEVWDQGQEPLSKCVRNDGTEVPFPSVGLMALDIEDNLVIVDSASGVLTKCDRNGKLLHQWGKQEEHAIIEDISRYKTVTNPQGIAVDMFGYIYVADTEGHGIQKYYDGEWIPSWPNVQGKNDYFFDSPHGLAVDNNLYVYVADTKNNRIKKYTSGGEKLLTLWGRNKAKKGRKYGEFNTPMDVAVNWDSTMIYVADTGNKRVQKFIINR